MGTGNTRPGRTRKLTMRRETRKASPSPASAPRCARVRAALEEAAEIAEKDIRDRALSPMDAPFLLPYIRRTASAIRALKPPEEEER